MIWLVVALGIFVMLVSALVAAPEIAGFVTYMAACARRWFSDL